jgi:putative tryptophan/tyrosine transport system substrate-binding protein
MARASVTYDARAASYVDKVLKGAKPADLPVEQPTKFELVINVHGAYDPVRSGLIASLARPGGNVTGTAWDPSPEIAGKCLEWLNDSVPRLTRVLAVWDPGLPGNDVYVRALETAAQRLNVDVRRIAMRALTDLEPVLVAARQHRAQALVVFGGSLIFRNIDEIVKRTRQQRLPDVYFFREAVLAGGLMSYGVDNSYLYRRTATYVDRILKGAKAGDLPVEQPTKFELFVNLKTAKALGLTIPASVLGRADRVIE